MVESNFVFGTYGDCVAEVKAKLNGYLRNYDRIYIGAATNPEARWRLGHSKRGFRKMVLLFCCMKAGSCHSMEKELIRYARGTRFRVRPENVLCGGESIRHGHKEYWVYVAVD
jgi:hypothetical protein